MIGDYNGDGKDDVGTWLSNTTRQVYVALAFATGMGQQTVWVDSGSAASDVLGSGDANGDGKKDLIMFECTKGKVMVALADGARFGAPTQWHGFFAVSTFERPLVADVTGDGKADIVTLATSSPTAFGDVYVATSDGRQFVDLSGMPNNSSKWHDFFAIQPSERIQVGDLNGDGKTDFFTFLQAAFRPVLHGALARRLDGAQRAVEVGRRGEGDTAAGRRALRWRRQRGRQGGHHRVRPG